MKCPSLRAGVSQSISLTTRHVQLSPFPNSHAEANPVRFRPSHGFYNRPMAEFMRTRGVELGYRPEFYLGLNFPWDVFFEIPEYYARHNARAAVPGRIVVFHDNQERRDRRGRIINQSRRTLAALPVFFSELEKQGFEARSLAHMEGVGMDLALLGNFSP